MYCSKVKANQTSILKCKKWHLVAPPMHSMSTQLIESPIILIQRVSHAHEKIFVKKFLEEIFEIVFWKKMFGKNI